MDKKKQSFPNNFFTQPRPLILEKTNIKEKEIPFEWSKSVLKGKSKVEIVSSKNN